MKTSLTFFAIIILCVFAFGVLMGVFYYSQKVSPALVKADTANKSMDVFRSRVIGSITAFGKVENMSGRIIVLAQGDETLSVRIRNDAEIFTYGTPAQADNPVKVETSLNNIKPGDVVNVEINVLPDNQLEGRAVVIFTDLN